MLLPHDPLIAEPLFLTRYIEKAGTGLMDMYARCRAAGLGDPQVGPVPGRGVVQVVRRRVPAATPEVTPDVTPEVTPEVAKLMVVISVPMSRAELQELLRLKDDDHFREAYLLPAIQAGLVEMTIPDKPRSRLQKYRLTAKGLTLRKILGRKDRTE